LSEINLYETRFDEDRFLEVFSLIRHPIQLEAIFLHAYRLMWKIALGAKSPHQAGEALQKARQKLFSEYEWSRIVEEYSSVEKISQKLTLIEKLAQKGSRASVEIVYLIEKQKGSKQVLEPLIKTICDIDDEINLVGMTYPEIKPLTDMFNKRKENFYGDDVKDLAQSTRDCYGFLEDESRLLKRILVELLEYFLENSARDGHTFTSSSSVEVPGR
jgi:hypothetical protein